MPDDLRLAELIAARLCHDFASPLVAVTGAAEMLQKIAGKSPELDLLAQGATEASARLRLLRLAFGPATDGTIAQAEVRAALSVYAARTRVMWDAPDTAPRPEARLALLCVLAVEPALPRGGTIGVDMSGGFWRVTATGPVLRPEAPALPLLTGASPQGDLPAAAIAAAMAARVATRLGRDIAADPQDSALVVTF